MTHRFRQSIPAVAGLAALLAAGPSFAQARPAAPSGPAAMPGMPMPGSQAGMPMSANHQEMMQSMEKMNRDMMGAPMTGDPDRDLVVMMMPHHQGAIDMARIYLRDGKDPAIRKMAQKIIVDQEREIRDFKAWLAKHPAPAR